MNAQDITVKSIDELLGSSSAEPNFKLAVRNLSSGMPQDLIQFNVGSPPVKVLRFICKMLESYPQIPFSSLRIEADSGCSNFTGHAMAEPGAIHIEFDWNCAWRAEEQGWKDAFGEPDQIRAARTLGYQCFRKLERAN